MGVLFGRLRCGQLTQYVALQMSTVDPAVARERPLEQLQASSPLKTHHLKPESPALDRNPKAVPMAVRYPENDVPAGGTQSAFPSETAGKSLSSSTIIPLKDSPKRNMSPGPLSPTRGLASHFSPSSESPAPLPLLSQASKTPSSDMKAASKPLDSMDSVGEDRSSLGREPSSAPSDAADARPFPNGQKPPPPGALDYTPLNDPVEVYIHPDDARDKVLAAIIKVILRTGNTPATPRELSGLILKGNVALLG